MTAVTDSQASLLPEFDKAEWPRFDRFPLNEAGGKVEPTARRLTDPGTRSIVVTGYSSLDYLIRAFGDGKPRDIDLVLGNEPAASVASHHPRISLAQEIREYWLERGLSILDGSAVAALIEAVKKGEVRFHLLDRLHAKIVASSEGAMLGSSNFSYGGLRSQREANVLFETGSSDFTDVHRIANNLLRASEPFDAALLKLLEDLLKPCSWPEALARATAELLEGTWLKRYTGVLGSWSEVPLWPSQRQAIAEALYILDTNGSVLIADPTGSGKTRLGLHLILALINQLYQTGRGHRTNAVVVCPPLIRNDWRGEVRGGGTVAIRTLSHGVLSSKGQKKTEALDYLRLANILVIDEAHNYLNHLSARSRSIRSTYTDNVILLTATPINRGPQDLLRLIEILGVDNLTDEQYQEYERLRRQRANLTTAQQHRLRDYIGDFTIRRTKTDLNNLIDLEPGQYVDSNGRPCRYPIHHAKTYSTGETKLDQRIATEIDALAQELRGLLYLRSIRKTDQTPGDVNGQERQLKGILQAASALARYNVLATMRSSRAALIEHIHGTRSALEHFGIGGKIKMDTGDVRGKLTAFRYDGLRYELDASRPEFLSSRDAYDQAIAHEVAIYDALAQKALSLSDARETARIELLERLLDEHELVLAFDSRVITVEYLKHQIRRRAGFDALAVHGYKALEKARARNLLGHGSRERNWVALCTDAMSEGVNLQGASAVVLLDMPGVIRLAEQRIGRVDRMNSEHDAIDVYWPDDSEPFRLSTSRKFLQRYNVVGRVIGVNMPLPDELKEEEEERFHVKTIINLYEQRQREIEDRGFLQDAFIPVRDLRDALVPDHVYEAYRQIQAAVHSRVSFVGSEQPWAFFALRGSKTRAPQWILVTDESEERDLRKVCEWLSKHLKNCEQRDWNAAGLERMLGRLTTAEHRLLPQRRRRALILLARALGDWRKDGAYVESATAESLLTWLHPFVNPKMTTAHGSPSIDYYQLAGHFLECLEPYYDEARKRHRRRRPFRLSDLRPFLRDKPLPADVLDELARTTKTLLPIENRIAACIVGVPNSAGPV